MADILIRGDSFSVVIPHEGEFHVDQSWVDGLKRKLQKKYDATFDVTLSSSADCLNVRISGECKSSTLDLDRLIRRVIRTVDWYVFWHYKGVKVFKLLEFKDRRLGTLTYHRNFEWWEADMPIVVESEAEVEPFEFNFYIHGLEGIRPPRKQIARAHTIIESLPSLHRRCIEAIGNEMLDVYNTGWREDNPEMSRDEFISHFSLASINIDEREDKLGYSLEEELFTEHGVDVTIVEGKITGVDLD